VDSLSLIVVDGGGDVYALVRVLDAPVTTESLFELRQRCHTNTCGTGQRDASFSFLMFGHGSGSHSYLDNILVQEIELKDADGASSSTPKITVSARLGTDTREAASRDDVELTIDYKLLHDTLANAVNLHDTPFGSLGKRLSEAAFSVFPRLPWLQLEVRSKEEDYTIGYRANYHSSPSIVEEGELFMQDLKTQALIGVYDWERKAKQDVEFGIHVSISPKMLRSSTIHRVIGRLMRVCPRPFQPSVALP
jgi:dihydroneopterin aldolase